MQHATFSPMTPDDVGANFSSSYESSWSAPSPSSIGPADNRSQDSNAQGAELRRDKNAGKRLFASFLRRRRDRQASDPTPVKPAYNAYRASMSEQSPLLPPFESPAGLPRQRWSSFEPASSPPIATARTPRPSESFESFESFELPMVAPKYPVKYDPKKANEFQLFTVSDTFRNYIQQEPIAKQSIAGWLNFVHRKFPRGGEPPAITLHDNALAIYLQKTPVNEQIPLGFLCACPGQGEAWVKFNAELLDEVIIPAVEKQITEYKKKWRYLHFDDLSPPPEVRMPQMPWTPHDRDGMSAPEIVPPPDASASPPLPPRPPKPPYWWK